MGEDNIRGDIVGGWVHIEGGDCGSSQWLVESMTGGRLVKTHIFLVLSTKVEP